MPARHPALRYGIALNDRGYFWESQEMLEAVWAAAPQGGRERILLRACIQIANAICSCDGELHAQLATARLPQTRRRCGSRINDAAALLEAGLAGGDGFADLFPTAALTELLKVKLAQPLLAKADWMALSAASAKHERKCIFSTFQD